MSNSALVSYKKISPNRTPGRKYKITRITPHCVVGKLSVESLGAIFASSSRDASSNYGIGADGRVGMYCEEKDRSWCSSSSDNDNRAVTIECASALKHPYKFDNVVFEKLIDLCVDICKRNGKKKLLWLGSEAKTKAYKCADDEMLLSAHRWFSATECPGDWMYSRMDNLADAVTKRLSGSFVVKFKMKMNVRAGAGTKYKKVQDKNKKFITCRKGYKYTIVATKKVNGVLWGKLKSGKGWVCIANKYCTRV